jgi:UDP-N-acetyl-D-glucosamine dehydrogenase
MINAAGNIDDLMPHRMTVKISFSLNKHKKAINSSRILFIGVAYKPNVADERESPALKIMDEVLHKGGLVDYHDPYIPEVKTPAGRTFRSVAITATIIESYDCVVITTNHSILDLETNLVPHAHLIVDMRNAIKGQYDHVFKL